MTPPFLSMTDLLAPTRWGGGGGLYKLLDEEPSWKVLCLALFYASLLQPGWFFRLDKDDDATDADAEFL